MSGTYNVDLLLQVREKIVNEPEKHNQSSWASAETDPRKGGECGTAYCVAGWAAVLDGQELSWQSDGSGPWFADYLETGSTVGEYAEETLGLSHSEAECLFAGTNYRKTVLSMLDRLIDAGKNGERVAEGDLLP